jgi:hypothetical protein
MKRLAVSVFGLGDGYFRFVLSRSIVYDNDDIDLIVVFEYSGWNSCCSVVLVDDDFDFVLTIDSSDDCRLRSFVATEIY